MLILLPEIFLSLLNLKTLFRPHGKVVYIDILLRLFQSNLQVTQDLVTEVYQMHVYILYNLSFSLWMMWNFPLQKDTGTFSQKDKRLILAHLSLWPLCVLVRKNFMFMLDSCTLRPLLTYVTVNPIIIWILQNGYLKSVEFMTFKFSFCGDSFKICIQHWE